MADTIKDLGGPSAVVGAVYSGGPQAALFIAKAIEPEGDFSAADAVFGGSGKGVSVGATVGAAIGGVAGGPAGALIGAAIGGALGGGVGAGIGAHQYGSVFLLFLILSIPYIIM